MEVSVSLDTTLTPEKAVEKAFEDVKKVELSLSKQAYKLWEILHDQRLRSLLSLGPISLEAVDKAFDFLKIADKDKMKLWQEIKYIDLVFRVSLDRSCPY